MPITVCQSDDPTIEEIRDVLLEQNNRYLEFRYIPQRPPPRPTVSVLAKRLDTRYVGEDLSIVKCFVSWYNRETMERGPFVTLAGTGNWLLKVLPMTRKKALPDGTGVWARYGFKRGDNVYRNYILQGIVLSTVRVSSKKVRLFPNVQQANLPMRALLAVPV